MNDSPTDIDQPLPTLNFTTEQEQYNSLIAAWSDEEGKCKIRRELRENKRSTHEERQKGTILEDETIIPDRTIDSGIKRSKKNYNSYITQAKRSLIITEVEAPSLSIGPLELWFARGMRFPHWKVPWFEMIDSMHVHGGAALEIVYDPTKPLNVALEYIPRDYFIIPLKTKDIQAIPRLLRCYEVTTIQLQAWAKQYSFDEAAVKDLYDRFHKKEEFIKIYRILQKVDGLVYNCWYSKDYTHNWLRAPRLHDIGLFDFDPKAISSPVPVPPPLPQPGEPPQPPQSVPLFMSPQWSEARLQFLKPAPLSSYPIIWFPFRITENQYLLEGQGRVSLDLHVQEAMTSLVTDTVNGTHRASRFYPSAAAEPGGDGKLIELGPMKHGSVMNQAISVFQPAYPSPIILSVMQALKVGKADESGDLDFAATARKDANKTAKELTLATQQSQSVEIDDMDVFSSPVLMTLALAFNIACHQAIFQLCKRPPNPELLIGDYNLQSAGDVEVVKREEDKSNAKEFFNIVQGTPMAEKVLQFLIQRFFPDQADEWLAALNQPDPKQIIAILLNALKNIPTNELPPDQRAALASVIATASNMVGIPSDQNAPGAPAPSGASSPAQSSPVQQPQGQPTSPVSSRTS